MLGLAFEVKRYMSLRAATLDSDCVLSQNGPIQIAGDYSVHKNNFSWDHLADWVWVDTIMYVAFLTNRGFVNSLNLVIRGCQRQTWDRNVSSSNDIKSITYVS